MSNEADDWRSVFPDPERDVYDLYRRPRAPISDLSHSCLLIVDVTRAFVGERLPTLEAARLRRTACGLPGWQALPVINRLEAMYRDRDLPVVFAKPSRGVEVHVGGTTVGAPSDDADDDPIPTEIAPQAGEPVFPKAKASAFFGTPLLTYLVHNRLRTVVIVGSTTSGCVRATTLDASSLGFEVVVVSDGCFDRSVLSHRVALYELDVKYASVLNADEIAAIFDPA